MRNSFLWRNCKKNDLSGKPRRKWIIGIKCRIGRVRNYCACAFWWPRFSCTVWWCHQIPNSKTKEHESFILIRHPGRDLNLYLFTVFCFIDYLIGATFSTREELNQFKTAVNSFHPALKYTTTDGRLRSIAILHIYNHKDVDIDNVTATSIKVVG